MFRLFISLFFLHDENLLSRSARQLFSRIGTGHWCKGAGTSMGLCTVTSNMNLSIELYWKDSQVCTAYRTSLWELFLLTSMGLVCIPPLQIPSQSHSGWSLTPRNLSLHLQVNLWVFCTLGIVWSQDVSVLIATPDRKVPLVVLPMIKCHLF